jgi:glyoxylase-like metal-dependent hydrolase (beta-lactamase superfamily II)
MARSDDREVIQVKIGKFTIDRVEELLMPGFAPQALLPELQESVFVWHTWLSGPSVRDAMSGNLMSSIHSWILRDGSNTVVIDTGTGNNKRRDFPGFGDRFHMLNQPYLERLAAVGVRPEDVTHVVITHLHMDQFGWNTIGSGNDWTPTFPNARYVFGSADMARVLSPSALAKKDMAEQVARDSILPVIQAGLVDQSEPGIEVFPGLTFELAPGHTPDQLAIRLRSEGEEALFTADAFHTPIQVLRPEWSSRFCLDQKAARSTRERILAEAALKGTALFPSHFCWPFCGRIVRDGSGYGLVDLIGLRR